MLSETLTYSAEENGVGAGGAGIAHLHLAVGWNTGFQATCGSGLILKINQTEQSVTCWGKFPQTACNT